MNNQKGFSLIVIVLIVIILLAGGIFAWQYFEVLKEESGSEQKGRQEKSKETEETSSEVFKGRLDFEIISVGPMVITETLLLSNPEITYSLTGPMAEELMNSLRKRGYPSMHPPWDVEVWGEKQEPMEILGTIMPRVYVTKYEVPKKGWTEGVIYSYTSCSYDICEDQLMLNNKGGGKYDITGELEEELLSIVGEGGYEDGRRIKIYGEMDEKFSSPAINVEKYKFLAES